MLTNCFNAAHVFSEPIVNTRPCQPCRFFCHLLSIPTPFLPGVTSIGPITNIVGILLVALAGLYSCFSQPVHHAVITISNLVIVFCQSWQSRTHTAADSHSTDVTESDIHDFKQIIMQVSGWVSYVRTSITLNGAQ